MVCKPLFDDPQMRLLNRIPTFKFEVPPIYDSDSATIIAFEWVRVFYLYIWHPLVPCIQNQMNSLLLLFPGTCEKKKSISLLCDPANLQRLNYRPVFKIHSVLFFPIMTEFFFVHTGKEALDIWLFPRVNIYKDVTYFNRVLLIIQKKIS